MLLTTSTALLGAVIREAVVVNAVIPLMYVGLGGLLGAILRYLMTLAGLKNATVWRGVLGFGAAARIRTTKLLDLSSDLPMIIEIVDEQAKINPFISRLNELFEQAGSGGLMTIEKVEIVRYLHGPRRD